MRYLHKLAVFIFVILLYGLQTHSSYSQGFDWVADVRMPSKTPVIFGGINVYATYSFLSTSGLQSTVTPLCGLYDAGYGQVLGGSARVELWNASGLSSWLFNVGLEQRSYVFNDDRTFLTRDGTTETQYMYKFVLQSNATIIFADCYYKYRVNRSHFHGAVGVSTNVSLVKNTNQYGEIVAPEDKVSREDFGSAADMGVSTFLVIPKLQLGYDLDMGNMMYATPYIAIGIPLSSSLMNDHVRSIDLSAGVAIQYALPWFAWN